MNDHHDYIRDMLDQQQRDDEISAALAAIGPEVLREPAAGGDTRLLTPWLAALATVGLDSDRPTNYRDAKAVPHRDLWDEKSARDNVDRMQPEVRARVTRALKLVELYRSRVPPWRQEPTAGIAVCDFQGAVKPNPSVTVTLTQFMPPVVPAPAEALTPAEAGEVIASLLNVTAPPTTRDRGRRVSRKVLVAENRLRWKTIESDLKDAYRNGLSEQAKDDARGWWWEGDAQAWAIGAGKMPGDHAKPVSSVFHRT